MEYRSYRFEDEDGDNASMVETEQSRESRKGTEVPLTETERIQLQETVKSTWEAGGQHPIESKV